MSVFVHFCSTLLHHESASLHNMVALRLGAITDTAFGLWNKRPEQARALPTSRHWTCLKVHSSSGTCLNEIYLQQRDTHECPWIAILLGKMMIIRYSMGYPVFRNQRLRISRWALAGPEAGSLPLSVSATAPRATDNLFGFPSAKSSLHRVWWICGSSSKVTKSIANQSMWKLEIISKDEKPNSSWSRATKKFSWGYPMWL